MSEFGNHFQKKSDQKLKKKQKINVKIPVNKKDHKREMEIWFKKTLGPE